MLEGKNLWKGDFTDAVERPIVKMQQLLNTVPNPGYNCRNTEGAPKWQVKEMTGLLVPSKQKDPGVDLIRVFTPEEVSQE